jgi:cell wall-associated NlpC family hydrolase
MKNLFFVAVASGIFSGTSITASAQTSVNLESVATKGNPKISLKFIEGIEITPERISAAVPVEKTEEAASVLKVNKTASLNSLANIETCSALQFKYATIMNTEVEHIFNTALYAVIDDWWATKYHYGGTGKNGIDCSAFTGKVLSAAYGINLPRTAHEQYKVAEKINKENLLEGDLVFFNTRGGVSHVGVYLGDNYFVHSSVASGVTISSLSDYYYGRKFIGGGRVFK